MCKHLGCIQNSDPNMLNILIADSLMHLNLSIRKRPPSKHATCNKFGESFNITHATRRSSARFGVLDRPLGSKWQWCSCTACPNSCHQCADGVLLGKLIHLLSGSLHDFQSGSKLGDSSIALNLNQAGSIIISRNMNYHEHSRLQGKGTNANSLNSSHQGNLSLLSSYWPYLEAYHYYSVCRCLQVLCTDNDKPKHNLS